MSHQAICFNKWLTHIRGLQAPPCVP